MSYYSQTKMCIAIMIHTDSTKDNIETRVIPFLLGIFMPANKKKLLNNS